MSNPKFRAAAARFLKWRSQQPRDLYDDITEEPERAEVKAMRYKLSGEAHRKDRTTWLHVCSADHVRRDARKPPKPPTP